MTQPDTTRDRLEEGLERAVRDAMRHSRRDAYNVANDALRDFRAARNPFDRLEFYAKHRGTIPGKGAAAEALISVLTRTLASDTLAA
jgi:hypothetical protein